MSEVKIILEDNQLNNLRMVIYDSLIEEIGKARKDVGLEQRYLKKKDLCKYLHVSYNTLDKWIELGLPKISIGGSIRYDKCAVDNWISQSLETI